MHKWNNSYKGNHAEHLDRDLTVEKITRKTNLRSFLESPESIYLVERAWKDTRFDNFELDLFNIQDVFIHSIPVDLIYSQKHFVYKK